MKLRALVCLLLILSVLLCGCGHIGDEEEILKAAEDVFRRASVITEVFYGEGLPCVAGEEAIRAADFSGLEELPFKDEASLKGFLSNYCSERLCAELWALGRYESRNGELFVNTSVSYGGGKDVFVLSDLRVVSIGSDRSRVEIPVITDKNGEKTEWKLVSTLVYENEDWKLDTAPVPSMEK